MQHGAKATWAKFSVKEEVEAMVVVDVEVATATVKKTTETADTDNVTEKKKKKKMSGTTAAAAVTTATHRPPPTAGRRL